jgi:hypothetical protein
MKNKLSTLLAAAVFGLGMFTISVPAEAHRHCHKSYCHSGCYKSCCHKRCYHKLVHCETMPSFWMYGYHYPAREVCWVKRDGAWVDSAYKWVPCGSLDGTSCNGYFSGAYRDRCY